MKQLNSILNLPLPGRIIRTVPPGFIRGRIYKNGVLTYLLIKQDGHYVKFKMSM